MPRHTPETDVGYEEAHHLFHRSRPMLARATLYVYAVLLVLSLLLEQPVSLAIAP